MWRFWRQTLDASSPWPRSLANALATYGTISELTEWPKQNALAFIYTVQTWDQKLKLYFLSFLLFKWGMGCGIRIKEPPIS